MRLAARLCADESAESRPGPAQHLPHPREGDRKGLFGAWPAESSSRRAAESDHRRGRLRRAGRGRGDHAPPAGRRSGVGPQAYHRAARDGGAGQPRGGPCETEFPETLDKFDASLPETAPARPTAFLTVQEGCDKFCTFCVVPYTRGAELSRPSMRIDARRGPGRAGVREITLLGQNVNAYHGAGPDGKRDWSLGPS
jgi:hypothetical protein